MSEVSKLVAKWRDAAATERDYYADALRACASQLEAALATPPAAPDEAMVLRACAAYASGGKDFAEAMRAALTAALTGAAE